MIAASLFIVCAVIALQIAWKYGTGPAPLDYHAAILDKADVSLPRPVSGLLLAQYRALASAVFALSVAIVAIAVFGVAQGATWAPFAALGCILAYALPAALVGRKAERVTGVRTPWRMGAVVSSLGLLGFAAFWAV